MGAVGEAQLARAGEVLSAGRGWLHRTDNEGIIKVVVDQRRNVIVGATSVAAFRRDETLVGRLRFMM